MKNGNNGGVYNKMQRMAELTVTMVLSGKLIRAKRILDAAEKIFLNGNYQCQNTVSNVYLYDVSTVLELNKYNVQVLLPISRQKEINAFK